MFHTLSNWTIYVWNNPKISSTKLTTELWSYPQKYPSRSLSFAALFNAPTTLCLLAFASTLLPVQLKMRSGALRGSACHAIDTSAHRDFVAPPYKSDQYFSTVSCASSPVSNLSPSNCVSDGITLKLKRSGWIEGGIRHLLALAMLCCCFSHLWCCL